MDLTASKHTDDGKLFINIVSASMDFTQFLPKEKKYTHILIASISVGHPIS